MLLADADVQVGDDPADGKDHHQSAGKSQGLPVLGRRRVFVSDNEVTLAKLVDDVDGDEVEGCAANCVHEGTVKGGCVGDERDRGLEVGDAGCSVSMISVIHH